MAENKIVDVIGIGIGPFNLGLAALLDNVPEVSSLFFEQKPTFDWHPGMLMEGTTLQVPFLADLVTMADPKSPYSFLNYLQDNGRLYNFYFLERFHIPRREYNDYCQWTAAQLNSCCFGKRVEKVTHHIDELGQYFEVEVFNFEKDMAETYYSKHIVAGVGTVPSVPDAFQGLESGDIFHSAEFMDHREHCRRAWAITVVGSGQSAAEIFHELLKEQDTYHYRLDWFTRSRGFFPMEYSKLGLEHFSPDYTDYFYELPKEKREAIFPQQDLLYKGISFDTISEIYDLLYERSVGGKEPDVRIQALTEVENVARQGEGYRIDLHQHEQSERFSIESDVVIAATGYRQNIPSCLSPLFSLIEWDDHGRYVVNKDYTLSFAEQLESQLFVQNGEMHTHGVGAPDLGLGAYRNAVIINKLAGREVYPVRKRNVFQQFGLRQKAGSEKREVYK